MNHLKQITTFEASRYTLRDLQLFRDETAPAVAALLANSPVMLLAKGNSIEDGGQASLYFVLSGQLEIAPDTHAGDESGGTSRISPGESVGEQAVLDDAVNLAAMTAVEDTELLVVGASLMTELIDHSQVLARNLLRLLSFRIRTANARLRRGEKLGEFYRQMSLNDPLTGLYNRAWLDDMLPKLATRATRDGKPLSLVMIDLDHFKRFNDTHGHIVGDIALSAAASAIRDALRPSDFAVRYGGEEMMAVLPDTSPELAHLVAERLCQRLRTAIIFTDMRMPLPHVTGSFGVASLSAGDDEQALMKAADEALYRAKEAGRDQVCG